MATTVVPSTGNASQDTLGRREHHSSQDVNTFGGGEGESAIPEDKYEEKLENEEDDWVHDARNPRNWSGRKKWVSPFR